MIGFDGSPDSEWALKELESSGLPPKAQAIILCAASPWHPDHYALSMTGLARDAKRFSMEALKRAEDCASKAAVRVQRTFPDWKVSSESVVDSPAHGLLAKVDAWKPDLVVLGCHGRTGLGKLLMGSVSATLLHNSLSDIRITRMRKKTTTIPRVLVALDGSSGADYAVNAVASRSWPVGTRIRLIAVLDDGVISKTVNDILGDAIAKKGRSAKANWLKAKCESATILLSSFGWTTDAEIRTGDPRMVILNEARNWKADCIFLGSRGLSSIGRFALGSVSSSVAAHAECTVEIIRKKSRSLRRSGK